MDNIILNQIQIFEYSCILGSALGVIYDIFRITRLAIRFKSWHIFLQDIIYFVLSGVCTFLFILAFNFGEVRFYIITGEIIGWVLYYITIGELVYRASDTIIGFVRKIFNFIWKILLLVWHKIMNILSKLPVKKSKT